MADKLDREAAISAKIAAIRAANEERVRRHAEVEADKKLAEKKRSAVDIRHAAGPDGTPHTMPDPDEVPFVGHKTATGNRRNLERSPQPSSLPPTRSSAQDRLRRDDGGSHVKSRFSADKDAPPPDPGYSFLADRMREDSDPEEGAFEHPRGINKSRGDRRNDLGGRRNGRGGGPPSTRGRGDDRHRRGGDTYDGNSPPKSLRPPHPFGNGTTSTPERANSLPPREQATRYNNLPTGFAQQDSDLISKPFANNSSQGRTTQHGAPLSPPVQNWRCPDPSCNSLNPSGSMACSKCALPWEKAQTFLISKDLGQHRRVKEQQKGLTIEVQFDKLVDDNDSSDDQGPTPSVQKPVEQPKPQQLQQDQLLKLKTSQEVQATNFIEMPPLPQLTNPVVSQALLQQQMQHQQHQQQLPVEAAPVSNWTSSIMTTMPIGQWSSEPPPHNFTQPQPAHWSHQQEQHQPLVDHFVIGSWQQPDQQQQQQQWGGESMQSWSNDTGIAWVQHPGYPTLQAPPAMVHAPMGPSPGSFMHIPYSDQPMMIPLGSNGAELMQQPHHPTVTQHSLPIMATQPFIPSRSQTHYYNNSDRNNVNTSYNRYGNTSNSGDVGLRRPAASNSSLQWRDREISKIPPRFQKQRMPVRQPQPRQPSSDVKLPRALSSQAPSTARRLSIFGTSNIVDHLSEADMSKDLGVPVRLIPSSNCATFREKIGLVDPALDRFVLVHGLCNEARTIALHTNKTDLEKGAESDQMAMEFTEIIADLLERIPYLSVFISTLLPRFDREDFGTMSNPNNVRKVMNVEISSRLASNDRVVFINNDTSLEWWKDEVKRNRLFSHDGHQLTAYGFSVMLDHWMVTLKPEVSKANLSKLDCDDSSASSSPMEEHVLSPRLEDVTPKLASVALNETQPVVKIVVSELEHKLLSSETTADVASEKTPELLTDKTEAVSNIEPLPTLDIQSEKMGAQIESPKADEISVSPAEQINPENVPLESDEDDEFHETKSDEFLDVSEQKQQQVEAENVPIADTDVDVATVDKDTDEFREKNNDELMEKELVTKKLSTDVERN